MTPTNPDNLFAEMQILRALLQTVDSGDGPLSAHVLLEGESLIRKEGLRLVDDLPPPAIRLSIDPVFSDEGPVTFGSEQRGVRLLALTFKCDEMCGIESVTRVTVGRVPVWHYCLLIRFIMEPPTQSTATISAKTNSRVI
jgi:hypothetical protein